MAKQVINIGTSANDGTGDKVRNAFAKCNANFTELYDAGGEFFIEKTKAEIDTLISGNDLVKGATYKITDCDVACYGGTTLFLQAVSENELSPLGVGEFYNPKYSTDNGYGIWTPYVEFATGAITGTFNNGEAVTGVNTSATGTLYRNVNGGFIIPSSGDFTGETEIEGDVTSATATISNVSVPSYAIDDVVIWGGYHWTNLTGDIGSDDSILALDNTNWLKVDYNSTDYNVVYDEISYDYVNDWIFSRKDNVGNIVEYTWADKLYNEDNEGYSENTISTFQWGNYDGDNDLYRGVWANKVFNSYVVNVNFRGYSFTNNEIGKTTFFYNNLFGLNSRFENNILLGGYLTFFNNTYGQNSYNYRNSYGQYSNNYNNTYGQNSNNNNNTYGQSSQNNNNTYGKYSNNNNNTYEQSSQNNNNTYGQSSQNNNNTYEQSSQNNNNTYEQSSQNNNNTYEQSSQNNNNTYGQYSNNNKNTYGQNSQNNNNTYGQGSANYNNTYEQEADNRENFYGADAQNSNNTYKKVSSNIANIHNDNSNVFNNTYEEEVQNNNNEYASGVVNSNNFFSKTSIISSNTYNNAFYKNTFANNNTFQSMTIDTIIENTEFKTATTINAIDISASTYLYASYFKTVYQRPDATVNITFIDDADDTIIANITD
jgi:hypothetical protein